MRDRGRFLALLACFVLSGFAGLVYEIAWTRELALIFGSSEAATVAVLAAYMGGLALGAALAARWLSRTERPVRFYAWIELAIGVAAFSVPLGLAAARKLQAVLLGGLETLPEGGGAGTTLFYLVTAFVVLLLPTALMGATLPLLVRSVVGEERQIGARPGLLYAANTVGASAGVLAAAFVLLPRLGLGQTVFAGVVANGLVFVIALALAGGERKLDAEERGAAPGVHGAWWVPPAVLVSGAIALTYEVLWVRLLAHVLGGSTYSFGTMLATFLAGLAVGSAIATRFATDRERSRQGFAWSQIAVAALSLAAFAVVDRLPDLAGQLGVGGASLAGGAALGALTLFPGAVAMGAAFPFAVRAYSRQAAAAAAASARIYAWNTVGAIFGAVAAGFVLLPALGVAGAAATAGVASLGLAAAVGFPRPRAWAPIAAAFSGLAALALLPPQTPWKLLRHSVLHPHAASAASPGEVLYYGVGESATVLLVEQAGEWRLTTNGLPESVVQPPGARAGRYQIARWLSLLPLALRPNTRTMMVVGLGAGNTVEYLPAGVESAAVIELERKVIAANHAVSDRRAVDPLADARVRLHVNDARGALLLTEQRFDAIVSQPSHPWTAGASSLFTSEFFGFVKERMTPGGVFVQWIGLAFVDEELIRTLVATLAGVFEHVEVYRPTTGALLFAASELPFDVAATAPSSVATAREAWGVVGVLDGLAVVAARAMDNADARRFAKGAPRNSDRRNLLQIRSPWLLGRPPDLRWIDSLLAPHEALLRQPPRRVLPTVRRLLRIGQTVRARRLVSRLGRGTERRVGEALVDLAVGKSAAAEASLRAVLLAEADHSEALAALAVARQPAWLESGAVELGPLATSDPAAVVFDGWRLGYRGDWGGVQVLETRLAAVAPGDPFFEPARRLRIDWRRQSRDPVRIEEAIELLDPLLVPGPRPADLLLRAELGRLAGRIDIALGSLSELVARRGDQRLFAAASRVFERLPPSDDFRYARLAERLSAAQRAGQSADSRTVQ